MYRLSPYTYLIEGLLGQAIGRQTVECAAVELVQVVALLGDRRRGGLTHELPQLGL